MDAPRHAHTPASFDPFEAWPGECSWDPAPAPLPAFEPPAVCAQVMTGRFAGARLRMKPPVFTIGSAKGCDVRIQEDGIAPLHATLYWFAEGWCVQRAPGAGPVLCGRVEVRELPVRLPPCCFLTLGSARLKLTQLPSGYRPDDELDAVPLHSSAARLARRWRSLVGRVGEALAQVAPAREARPAAPAWATVPRPRRAARLPALLRPDLPSTLELPYLDTRAVVPLDEIVQHIDLEH